MAGLTICLFGPIQVLMDGNRAATFTYNKARALLAYLAVEANRAHARQRGVQRRALFQIAIHGLCACLDQRRRRVGPALLRQLR